MNASSPGSRRRRAVQGTRKSQAASSGQRLVKVAIVGGGCAGLSAAWELSRPDPDRQEKFEVTIYERSWRLGGKGASGRDKHGRIREHGVHIWLGFYENAFRMMRECYKEVSTLKFGPDKGGESVLPFATFDDAFFPEAQIGVASAKEGGSSFDVWSGLLPPMEGLPGTPLDEDTNPFTVLGYLIRAVEMSRALMHSVLGPAGGPQPKKGAASGRSTLDETLDLDFSLDPSESPALIVERVATLLRAGLLTSAAGLMQGVTILETLLRERNPAPQFSEGLLNFLEALVSQARKQLRDVVTIDPEIRRKTEVLDLIMTIAVGIVRDNLLFDPRGLDAINNIDCKDWLLRHGAVKESVESPFVTGLYDLAFCYRDGDRETPALAAGQALRGALRMFFSYRGAIFWRMRAGMGETVFSPLYRALKNRGVKFEFLHSLRDLELSGDGHQQRINQLTFDVAVADAAFLENPLDHFGCWAHDRPDTPRSHSRDVSDFDAVVLAMGIDGFSDQCRRKLGSVDNRWSEIAAHVKTIATQAAQVWMTRDVTRLGWKRGSILVSAMDNPFETWADMTYTLAAERAWRAHPDCPPESKPYGADVKSVAYFCGALANHRVNRNKQNVGTPKPAEELKAQVASDLATLLESGVGSLWPSGTPATPFLAKADGTSGGGIGDQHYQANYEGSDRYTVALPGSIEFRISPLERVIENMTIAGDWTECGFNEGCIEAAVMSGMLAAHAISGKPELSDIVAYDHP